MCQALNRIGSAITNPIGFMMDKKDRKKKSKEMNTLKAENAALKSAPKGQAQANGQPTNNTSLLG